MVVRLMSENTIVAICHYVHKGHCSLGYIYNRPCFNTTTLSLQIFVPIDYVAL
jgi:hypothetical protein